MIQIWCYNINCCIVLLVFSTIASGATLEISSIANTHSTYTFPAVDGYVYAAKVSQRNYVTGGVSSVKCTVGGVDDQTWRTSNLLKNIPTYPAGTTVHISCIPSVNYAGYNHSQSHSYYQCRESETNITNCTRLYMAAFDLGTPYNATLDYNPIIDITTGTGTLVNSISSIGSAFMPVVHFNFAGKVCNDDNQKCVPVSVVQNSENVKSDVNGNYRLTDATTLKVDWTGAEGGIYKSSGVLTFFVE